MPAVQFWPADFDTITTEVFGEDVPTGAVLEEGVSIRRVGDEPAIYDPTADLLAVAYFETVHVPMAALTEVYGLRLVLGTLASGNEPEDFVGIQVSVDGGSTYLAWTGAAWVAQAFDGDYCSRAVFDENSATLPLENPRTLGFRFELTPDGDESPVLQDVVAYVEWDYDPHVDVHETVKALLDDELRVPTLAVLVGSGAATVTLASEYTPTTVTSVYDVMNDPLRNDDLFDSFDADTRVVSLTGVVADGARLEVRFLGSAPVVVARADEMVTIAELPVTIARVAEREDVRGRMTGSLLDRRLGTTVATVRDRQHPVLRDVIIRVEHCTTTAREAIAAIDRVREVFSSSFRMLATGETPLVSEDDEGRMEDAAGESLYNGRWNGRMRLYFHSRHYTERQCA
ncbi:hypothetical protein, partial [Microbacterium sp.]|uniref:hypothetical protein n=1 Tax=Microbacterium sp. TaxID=51671 RepID=UPI002733F861